MTVHSLMPAGPGGPTWMPSPGAAPAPVVAGRHWDAITISVLDGPAIRRHLPALTPAIRHEALRTLTWLTRPGAARSWALPPGVTYTPHGAVVLIPAADTAPPHPGAPPPVWWTRPPGPDPLTPPLLLRAALLALTDAGGGRAY